MSRRCGSALGSPVLGAQRGALGKVEMPLESGWPKRRLQRDGRVFWLPHTGMAVICIEGAVKTMVLDRVRCPRAAPLFS
eukprot:5683894-Pyramimonas_sp.AAC.1